MALGRLPGSIRWASLRRAPRASIGGTPPVWLLTAALGVAAVLLQWLAITRVPPLAAPFHIPWPALAAGFALGEVFVVRIQLRRDTHSFSLSELPLVIGLFFAGPTDLVLAQGVGAATALAIHRRSPLAKLSFNTCNLVFEACLAIIVFRLVLGGQPPIGPAGWAASLAAALTASVVGLCTISAAIYLTAGRPHGLGRLFVTGTLASFFNIALALMAVTVTWHQPLAAWLPAVLAGALFLAYRAYGSLRQQHEGLEMLYESTRLVQQSVDVEKVVGTLLSQARAMFRAERAELVILGEGGRALTSAMHGDGRLDLMRPESLDPTEGVWARIAAEGRGVCLSRPIQNERLRNYFARQGIRDAMVVPLRGQDVVLGTLMVANHQADASTFTPDELKLFDTMALHASVSLQNGRLVDELRQQAADHQHQALHDPLTGLANRRLFHDRIDRLISSAGAAGGTMAVLMMDLDRFKEVNDTLGHRNGDILLKDIASRLTRALPQVAVIARLSGDEFAILLHPATPHDGADAAARLLHLLDEPMAIEDVSLQIGASIGIAMFPDHGLDADTLLQRADVAMYLAKSTAAGYEFYAPERDEYSPARLALVGELRRAIDHHELVVMFQPIADLRTGRICSAEALVRWQHPVRGLIQPDQFIPMAEHTGLIRPLTEYVLETATKQCRAWRDAGHEVNVAVNLSVRALVDASLPATIGNLLGRVGLPASALELELTEGAIMGDPERVEATLGHLRDAGIQIAIDDFGTGYSSLSRLKRLPVDVLKIDRSFVMALGHDDDDLAIVRSTIDLGRNLGLRTVAEGVETARVWDLLLELGCDLAQGYFVSRPISADDLTAILDANHAGDGPRRSGRRAVRLLGPARARSRAGDVAV